MPRPPINEGDLRARIQTLKVDMIATEKEIKKLMDNPSVQAYIVLKTRYETYKGYIADFEEQISWIPKY